MKPAFKEGYPLRKCVPAMKSGQFENFKLSVCTARAETQIHTHMCYSDFNDIISTIEAMDADVITMENAAVETNCWMFLKKPVIKMK